MAAGSKEDTKCGSCSTKVTNRTGGMKCAGFCVKWFHLKCCGVSKEECAKFKDLGRKSVWYCVACGDEVRKMIEQRKQANLDPPESDMYANCNIKMILDKIGKVEDNYHRLEKRVNKIEKSQVQIRHPDNSIEKSTSCLKNDATVEGDAISIESDVNVCDDSTIEMDEVVGEIVHSGADRNESVSETVNNTEIPKVVNKVSSSRSYSLACAVRANDNTNAKTLIPAAKNHLQTTQPVLGSKESSRLEKRKPTFIVGTLPSDGKLKIKQATKKGWIFVTNLALNTDTEALREHMKQITTGEVICQELTSKFRDYKSYKIGINLEDVEKAKSPDMWPEDVKVDDFRPFSPKNRFLGKRRWNRPPRT